MKFYLVFLGFLVTVRAEERSAAPTTQERRGTDKQENDVSLSNPSVGSSAVYRNSLKSGSAHAASANVLNYNPQAIYSTQPLNYVPQSGVKYTPSPIPAHIMYGFSPQPQQFEYEPQSVAYAQSAAKSAGSGSRHAAASLPAFNFSPASEVSSFRFSSPLVTYSNQGVLSQVTGKLASSSAGHSAQESQSAPVSKNSGGTAAAAPQQTVYTSVPQFAYNSVPQQKQEYVQASPEYAYVQAPQQVAYAAPQRVVYATQPSQNAAAKESYASVPRQYYAVVSQLAYSPQQLGHAAAGLQLAYALAPQGGHSNSQQVYSVPSQAKYANVDAQEVYN
ncbi:hypothetical protein RN001_003447 [Aquatica leii]|uniref:Uncharacterized protein n=1 Tax=Aquatica leii TaxID=1421715 RepID=A0AAN7SDZ8_9COLE|nr:hypothetical protein RN001_003447 [Aquatica leii]